MGRTLKRIAAAAACLALVHVLPVSADEAFYTTYLAGGDVPSLKEHYAGQLKIGISAEYALSADLRETGLIMKHCGLMACGEAVRGKNLLSRGSSKKEKNNEHARLRIGNAAAVLNYALENEMEVRSATIIQPGNTPDWFFNEEWADAGNIKRAAGETVLRRMENAVRDQISLFNESYPDLITEWEVVRSCRPAEEDLFLETIGENYIFHAFRAARKAAREEQKLLWHLADVPDQQTLQQLQELRSQGILDGVVLTCSMTMDRHEAELLERKKKKIADFGLEIHIDGFEIANTDRTAAGEIRLAVRYKNLFAMAEKLGIRSITFPALRDSAEQGKGTPPRLINQKGRVTPAFFGALQDGAIPDSDSEAAVREAVKSTDLEKIIKKEAGPVIVYKKAGEHNPVMVQRFGADPWAMVYKDRVYLYMTGDEPVMQDGKKPKTNDYGNIVTLRVLSSDDLVNWTDHGSVRAAGGNGAAKWASNSWAPCAAWKNFGGKDRFFLYFANSGGGIGVLTADSPTGPFTDPIGKPLISRNTPTCSSVTWLFDPAVLVDEDGSAYLYFGGGVPEGKQADPGTARAVKLGDDMISLDGDPVAISPPWLFEDSGINRFGDTYVYSYCSNFSVPAAGSPQGFGSGEIVYMTSESPLGPFEYAGQVLKNPGYFFGTGGNNHHCMFSFRDQWYITYHAATLDKAMGWNAGYRSVFVDRLALNENGLPAPSRGTITGVARLKPLDPFTAVSGATAVSMAGATTVPSNEESRKSGAGCMAALSTLPDSWVSVEGADFGEEGASYVRVTVRSEMPSKIEILADSIGEKPVAVLEIPACGTDTEVAAKLPEPLTGTHDLYFRFTESDTMLLEWQFQ